MAMTLASNNPFVRWQHLGSQCHLVLLSGIRTITGKVLIPSVVGAVTHFKTAGVVDLIPPVQ